MDPNFNSLAIEMNRGFLQVLALVALERKRYGYAMIRHLDELGFKVEENTLYPLLRRLEKNGWIRSEWEVGEDRPRKFYRTTEKGRKVRARALEIWNDQGAVLRRVTEANRHA